MREFKKNIYFILAILSLFIASTVMIFSGSIESIIVGWTMFLYTDMMDKYCKMN